jgi:tetratricopeptide (TPR) repeat protein
MYSGRPALLIVVRNFDCAQNLAKRFFTELARRTAVHRDTNVGVVIETTLPTGPEANLGGMRAMPLKSPIPKFDVEAGGGRPISESAVRLFESGSKEADELFLERNYPALLSYYRSTANKLAAARVALDMLPIYVGHGYYYEAKALAEDFLPYVDLLTEGDERGRFRCLSLIDTCSVYTEDESIGLKTIENLAVPHITRPDLLAHVNYILSMRHLRYAKVRSVSLAELYMARSLEYVDRAKADRDVKDVAFLESFVENGLAFLRVRQGRHQEAIDLCLAGFKNIGDAYGEKRFVLHRSVLQYNVAQVYVALDRLEEALKYYSKAMEMDIYYSDYYNESGNLLQKLGRYSEAIPYYATAMEYSPPYYEVYYNKGVCHAREGHAEEALWCFDMSVELNPYHAESYALRAELLDALDFGDRAIADYNLAITLKPSLLAARVNRAVYYFNQKVFYLALSDMNYVIGTEKDDASHYENRAAIYQAMNQEDLYLSDIEAANRCRVSA